MCGTAGASPNSRAGRTFVIFHIAASFELSRICDITVREVRLVLCAFLNKFRERVGPVALWVYRWPEFWAWSI